MPNNNKTAFYLYIVSAFIIAGLVGFFFWLQIIKILEVRKNISAEETKIAEYSMRKELIESFKKEPAKLEEFSKKTEEILPSGQNVLNVVINLEEIAKKTNLSQQLQVTEKTIAPKTEDLSENSQKQKNQSSQSLVPKISSGSANISIILSGNFKDFIAYLIYLEKNIKPIALENATINLQGVATAAGVPSQPNQKTETKAGSVNAVLDAKLSIR